MSFEGFAIMCIGGYAVLVVFGIFVNAIFGPEVRRRREREKLENEARWEHWGK